MPELPDIVVYLDAIERSIVSHTLTGVRLHSPFVLRSVETPPAAAVGTKLVGVRRLGKRVALEFEGELFFVIHLMIAGRLQWREARGGKLAPVTGKIGLAAFDFDHGSLLFTEASSKKRASLHVVRGVAALDAFDRGGLEPLGATLAEFARTLRLENRTLKRALTDPTLFSGIGNAYSDEILHLARSSPFTLTSKLDDEAVARLHAATQTVLTEWIDRLRRETGDSWPSKVTAFRPEMAVHGRFDQPCPVCGTKVQRIAYAENEANYCPTCQTGGKLLADRGLSKLLRGDWPKTLGELEERKRRLKGD
jgi:formamidopyrimidine-DNA glycosylase